MKMESFSRVGGSLPLRALTQSHADGDGDRGADSRHPVCAHRCSPPDASPAGPGLRRGYPFCRFFSHRTSSGSSFSFCFAGLYTFLFSGSVIITGFGFYFVLGLGLQKTPSAPFT